MAMHSLKDSFKRIQRFSEHLSPAVLIALADLDN